MGLYIKAIIFLSMIYFFFYIYEFKRLRIQSTIWRKGQRTRCAKNWVNCKLLSFPSFKEPSQQEVRVNPRCPFNDIVFWIVGACHYINKLSPIRSFYFMSQYWILTPLRSTPRYFCWFILSITFKSFLMAPCYSSFPTPPRFIHPKQTVTYFV